MTNSILNDISYGLYVVGTSANNTLAGCIVNTVIQVTAEPEKVTVCLNHESYTAACIQNTREFTVSILTENAPAEVIGQFGFKSSREESKFGGCGFELLMNNMPVLTEYSSGWLHCRVENIVDVGTHVIFVAEVIDSKRISDNEPMTYAYYHNVVKGTSPKAAPTYHSESEDVGAYVCDVCGYVYRDGNIEDLPDDWVCPICGVGKDRFSKIQK